MPIQTKRVRVTLDQNPNLKVTARTREHLGVSAVGTDEVQARLLGIPGPSGTPGIVWNGEWSATAEYEYGDAVFYDGSSYIYIGTTPSVGNTTDNTAYWDVLTQQGDQGPQGDPGAAGNEHAALMNEPTGFPNLTDSLITYDDTTRTITILPSVGGGTFDYWISGVKHTVSAAESVVVPDVESMYFIYYDSDNILKVASEFPIPLTGKATVFMVYWDAENQEFSFHGEERHGVSMDWATHAYLHETQGAQYANGFDLHWTEGGDGSTEDELKIGIEEGVIYDEDLRHHIRHSNTPTNFFEQYLFPFAKIPIWYRVGTDGHWRTFDALEYPLRMGDNFPLYNLYSGVSWGTADVANNEYFTMFIYATNEVHEPILAIMGQAVDTNLEKSLEANGLDKLDLGELPSPEFKLLYRLVFQAHSSYSNSFKSRLVQVDDYRAFQDHYNIPSASVPVPGGSGGDKNFVHEQTTPLSTWTINHGLNKYPSIDLTDELGEAVEACVEFVDINTIRIEFSEPFAGKAYFN